MTFIMVAEFAQIFQLNLLQFRLKNERKYTCKAKQSIKNRNKECWYCVERCMFYLQTTTITNKQTSKNGPQTGAVWGCCVGRCM